MYYYSPLKYKDSIMFLAIFFMMTLASLGQGGTCQTAEVLCDPNASFPASVSGADLGSVLTCIGNQPVNNCQSCTVASTPNAAFYTLTVVESGDLYLQIATSPAVDVDFAIWGPYTDPDAIDNCSGGTFPPGNPIDCDYSVNPMEEIDVPGVLRGESYILLITNFSGLPTDITLTPGNPNGTNTAVLGGPLAFSTSQPATYLDTDAPVNLQTNPPVGDINLTNVNFSGTGITDALNGTFDPWIAGPGVHTITVTADSWGCPVSTTIDITVNLDMTDTDGDGVRDAVDVDDDNDGIPDSAEGTGDTDGDGIPDYLDLDSDNDGILDVDEGGNGALDTNGDGVIDSNDTGYVDSNGDGQADGSVDANEEPDTDGDGVPDYQDLDSDNDGINDVDEDGQGASDSDGDGMVDGPDSDGDGIQDVVDADDTGFGEGVSGEPDNADSDGDGIPNSQDLDSDNDGINDTIEGGNDAADTNGDGVIDNNDTGGGDADGDGIPDSVDGDGGTGYGDSGDPDHQDSDGDGIPDSQDLDSDDDGVLDVEEGNNGDADTNDDGVIDGNDTGGGDADGDGIPDSVDQDPGNYGDAGNTDTTGNNNSDPTDPNSGGTGTVGDSGTDNDGDGIADSIDDCDNAEGTPDFGLCDATLSTSDVLVLNTLTIYPNPVKDILTIRFAEYVNELNVELYSITGQLIYNKQTTANSNTATLDLSSLSSGIYLMKIHVNESSTVKRLLIQ